MEYLILPYKVDDGWDIEDNIVIILSMVAEDRGPLTTFKIKAGTDNDSDYEVLPNGAYKL